MCFSKYCLLLLAGLELYISMTKQIIQLLKSDTFTQLIKYGIVGGIGFIIDFGVFWLLNNYMKVSYLFAPQISELTNFQLSTETINTSISHIISSILAIINNFILNSYFTFKVTDSKIKRFLSFFSIAIVGLVISTMLLSFFIQVLQLSDLLAKLISVGIVAILQFGFNKFLTFKEKPTTD